MCGMRTAAGLLFVGVMSAAPAFAQYSAPPTQYRCEVPTFSGAMSPQGASATMTVVSDGLFCTVMNWGVPSERRNPATAGEITEFPRHGTAMFGGAAARYVADRGYVGRDAFAYRATAFGSDGLEHTMIVRVEVDVKAAAFDRNPMGGNRWNMLTPAMPIRVGNDVPIPRKVKDVRPIVPPEARIAQASGAVVIDATIDAQGKVSGTRVVTSMPVLDGAAQDAVKQWEFTPTIVDGKAVPVVMTVTVNFAADKPVAAPPPALAAPPAPAPPAPAPTSAGAPPAPRPTAPPPAPSSAPAAAAATAPVDLNRDPNVRAGIQALQRKQYDEALKAFRKATESPAGRDCADCFLAMAQAYDGIGAQKNVVESCDRAIALGGDDKRLLLSAHQMKGVALQALSEGKDLKRLRDAETELRAAVALDADAPYVRMNLGIVLLQEQRDADGVAELKQELALRPESPHAKRIAMLIENPRRAREAYAPDFSLVTVSHEFIESADLRGKIVLLDFWGTWCQPCVQAVPSLRDLNRRFSKDGFVLIGISSDNSAEVVRDFAEKNDMTWPEFWDRDRKVQQSFDIRAFPTYVLIDDEGIMRFKTTGSGPTEAAKLEDEVKRMVRAAANRRK